MYQCAQAATPAPTATAAGSHSSRQRRDRHPIASSSTVTVTAWTVPGIQPCISDVWCSASTENARFVGEPVT